MSYRMQGKSGRERRVELTKHKRSLWVIAILMATTLIAAACGGDGDTETAEEDGGEAEKGGTITWESEEFAFVGGFDPVGEYLGDAWGVMSNLLIRNLVSYEHVAGDAGNVIVPDVAADMPEISEDGLTYTFTLKDGIMFGPPVSREVVCEDFEYAFRRIATESLVAQYANYYEGAIEGLEIGEDPGPGGISGIECEDEKTITFTLAEATGDFLYRLAMPAAAPVPEEVGECFDKAGEYGRFLISSAGYMIEGSDELDISSCEAMKPISGYDPDTEQILVRNPDYDQSTDEYRENYFDRFEHVINTNTNDLEQRADSGENDIIHTPTPQTLRKFSQDPEIQDRLYVDSGDRTWYITMNLNEPPFDDIHVRKAANLVMDKEGLRLAWGGEVQGEIATHIIPDTMLGGSLDDYDPYPSENNAGDEEAAKAEMEQSAYDSDGDGVCDAPECEDVLTMGSNTPPNTDMLPVLEESFSKIGITLQARELTDAYTPITTVAKRVPLSYRPGWGKDYADVFTFVGVLFDGRNTLCTGNYNYSLVGFTAEKAKECGVPLNNPEIPSVDDKIDECKPLLGDERVQCWAELDQILMEDVVPWVPYLDANAIYATSGDVTAYEFDQFSGTPAWSKIAVDPNS